MARARDKRQTRGLRQRGEGGGEGDGTNLGFIRRHSNAPLRLNRPIDRSISDQD